MINRLIEQYVNRMTKNDIIVFANKNGIELNEGEVKIIYNHIKKNWKTIVYGNPREILDDIKQNFDNMTYNRIENLYMNFKEKYKNYL